MGAYLATNPAMKPDQLGSLKGQDVGKLIVAGFLLVGCIVATVASVTQNPNFQNILDYIRGTMLT